MENRLTIQWSYTVFYKRNNQSKEHNSSEYGKMECEQML